MKFKRAILIILSFVLMFSVFTGCKKDDGEINAYRGGEEFDFGKWTGDENNYTITQQGSDYIVDYNKTIANFADRPLISEVSGDFYNFYYINFTLSGTEGKEILVRLEEGMVSDSLIADSRIFLKNETATFSFRMRNRLALAAVKNIYFLIEPKRSGLGVNGTVTIHRSWFSNELPEGTVYEELRNQKSYKFAAGSNWVRVNGWFLDTGWTKLKIAPAPNKETRIYTETANPGNYSSAIYPFDPPESASTLTIKFDNVGNKVKNVAVLLRGGEKAWVGTYYDYYETETIFWTNTVTGNATNEAVITYDLAANLPNLSGKLDEDGVKVVVFFNSHGNHPAYDKSEGADNRYEVLIKSITIG